MYLWLRMMRTNHEAGKPGEKEDQIKIKGQRSKLKVYMHPDANNTCTQTPIIAGEISANTWCQLLLVLKYVK